ncbi:hypothetical protein CAL7102_04373 [Dulcicalothrix desertica PCC 7102]|nr:hypothetical protein CAL7102_04373 [Dulcicalothrix desertica PCC 7102]
MKLLIDTHVLIWYLADDPKLPSTIRDLIIDPQNQIFVSAATAISRTGGTPILRDTSVIG